VKKLTSTLLIAALLTLSPLTFAKGHNHDRKGPDHEKPLPMQVVERMHHVLKQLDLSEEQKTAIKAEFKSMKEETKPLMQELQKGRAELHELLIADDYDAAAVSTLADRQGAATADMVRISAATVRSVMDELTVEQRAQVAEMRQEHHDRMAKRVEHMQRRLEKRDDRG
jgi:protein CpxP